MARYFSVPIKETAQSSRTKKIAVVANLKGYYRGKFRGETTSGFAANPGKLTDRTLAAPCMKLDRVRAH